MTQPHSAYYDMVTWRRAYLRFLMSRDESLALKVAPLALFGVLPFDILSNVVPIIGELDDVSYAMVAGVILFRTFQRVRKYR